MQEIAEALSKTRFANKEVVVELSIVGAARMRALNKEYRGKDKVTDVLSFNAPPMPPISGQPRVLGEIIVCNEKVGQQAKRYGHSEARELGFLIVHGVLHLLGHDHKAKKDEQRMNEAAEQILAALRLTR